MHHLNCPFFSDSGWDDEEYVPLSARHRGVRLERRLDDWGLDPDLEEDFDPEEEENNDTRSSNDYRYD